MIYRRFGDTYINNLFRILREHGASHEFTSQLNNKYTQLALSIKRIQTLTKYPSNNAFIVAPHQLDTTNPDDFPEHPEWREERKRNNLRLRSFIKVPFNLSHTYNLTVLTLGRNAVASRINPWGILPEFNRVHGRRCCFVRNTGIRCTRYAKEGEGVICKYHIKSVLRSPHLNMSLAPYIKSESLKNIYEKYLNDKNKADLSGEIAILRTLLHAQVTKINDLKSLEDLPLQDMAALSVLAEKVINNVKTAVDVETKLGQRLDIEQVFKILLRMCDTVIKIVNPSEEQCALITDAMEEALHMKPKDEFAEDIKTLSHYGLDAQKNAE